MIRKLLFSFAIVLFFGASTLAQNGKTLTGKVQDEERIAVPYATVVLIESGDTTISQFTISRDDGSFSMEGVEPNNYVLQVTFYGYQHFVDTIEIKEDFDYGLINMKVKDHTLKEVLVKDAYIPILFKKDTLEFNSAAFGTDRNDVAEDLLKKLPGIEVDKDGNIIAQGEKVTKVLVDGKEFFSDDPKLATKNLPADAIKKVQVVEKEGDDTGDVGTAGGQKEKTINLVLKEDKKKGFFGNASLGYGEPGDLKSGKFSVNRFSPKLQFALIGMGNNINRQGFTWDDYMNFQGGSGSNGGYYNIGGFPLDDFGGSNNGVSTTYGFGANLNYDFSDKTRFSSSYFYSLVDNNMEKQSSTEYFSNEDQFDTYSDYTKKSKYNSHHLDYGFKHEFDTTQKIHINGYGSLNQGSHSNFSDYISLNSVKSIENSTQNYNDSEGFTKSGEIRAVYSKDLRKKGRNLYGESSVEYDEELSNSYIEAENTLNFITDTLLQTQDFSSIKSSFYAKIRYCEPIQEDKFLYFTYSHKENRSFVKKNYFDEEGGSNEKVFLSSLSSEYDNTNTHDLGGIWFQVKKEKGRFWLGANVQKSILNGNLIDENIVFEKEFLSVLPGIFWNYDLTKTKSIYFNYSTDFKEPEVKQLQPVIDNTNPLYTIIGNPDLGAEYEHRIYFSLRNWDQEKLKRMYFSVNANLTKNKISNAVEVDQNLVQSSKPVNLGDYYFISSYFSYNFVFKSIGLKIRTIPEFRYSKRNLFINSVENQSENSVPSFNLQFGNNDTKINLIQTGVEWNYNITSYSKNASLNQDFLTTSYYLDLTLRIKKWRIRSDYSMDVYSGDAFDTKEVLYHWNASISRNILKDDRGELKITFNDIFNQNRSLNRTSYLNFIREETTNAIGRYFLLTFRYSIKKAGGEEIDFLNEE